MWELPLYFISILCNLKSNGLDLANFTKSVCFKTRQVHSWNGLSHGGCSKTRNQLRGSTFHSRDIYCLFIVPQYQSIHFKLSPCQSSVFSKLLVFCKPLLSSIFSFVVFNKPIHYYPNSNNQKNWYFHQSPSSLYWNDVFNVIHLCFKVSTATLATSTEIESVKYGLLLMKIFILGIIYLPNQTVFLINS
jgi:hypothetical protein